MPRHAVHGFHRLPGFQVTSCAVISVFEFANMEMGEPVYDVRLLSETGGSILGDRVQLQQVIVNLIMNGIEAMSAVMRQPRVLRVRSQIDGPGRALIAVEDSGPGLAPEAMDRLFAPSSRRNPAAWAWGCRSAVRSSMPMAVASGHRRSHPGAPFSNSPCRPQPKGFPDRGPVLCARLPTDPWLGESFQSNMRR
jgi:hypothetical protein